MMSILFSLPIVVKMLSKWNLYVAVGLVSQYFDHFDVAGLCLVLEVLSKETTVQKFHGTFSLAFRFL